MTLLQEYIPSSVFALFDLMEIAEEEIRGGMERHPEAVEEVWGLFLTLMPHEHLRRHPVLYRSHCRYLITRVAEGKELKSPSPAEYCAIFSVLSLQAPLRSDLMVAYWKCFQAALPEQAQKMRSEDSDLDYQRESYPGVVEEILTGMGRKLRRYR